jgi:hypothetical protein
MTKSQFQKRQEKAIEEITKKREEIRETAAPKAEEPTFTQTALDIYTRDGGRHYEVAEIQYNPTTREAKVVEIYKISRLVALQYDNTKVALNTLKRKLVKES